MNDQDAMKEIADKLKKGHQQLYDTNRDDINTLFEEANDAL